MGAADTIERLKLPVSGQQHGANYELKWHFWWQPAYTENKLVSEHADHWAEPVEKIQCTTFRSSLVFLSLTPVAVERIPWMASLTVSPGALWPRLYRHENGPRASPRQSLRCWGRTNGPSTRPADRLGTTSLGPPSKRPLLLVSDQATAIYFCSTVCSIA